LAGANGSSLRLSAVQLAAAGSYRVEVSNPAGKATSRAARLTVEARPEPPVITRQPADQTVVEGDTATFEVVATGTQPLSYQWSKDGTALAGANSPALTLLRVQLAAAGSYRVEVLNQAGKATSAAARLTVLAPPEPPVIVQSPVDQTVTEGDTATFEVVASGTAPLSYQWQRNGTSIAGATQTAYSLSDAQLTDSGSEFSVVVGNDSGTVTSASAELTVLPQATPGSLLWISDENGRLARINIHTGASESVVNVGLVLTDIAFSPSGELYGMTQERLVRVDPGTGATTDIGAHQIPSGNALVFGPDGRLYGAGRGSTRIYEIDPDTGAATALGDVGFKSVGDLAFNGGELFLTATEGRLVRIDQSNWKGSVVGDTIGFVRVMGLATAEDGVLYGVSDRNIIAIDTTTGRGSLMSTYSESLGKGFGTAFLFEAVMPPHITRHPQDLTREVGTTASFSVVATGTGTLDYQWFKDGSALVDAIQPSLTLAGVQLTDAGLYHVEVSNEIGLATSTAARLTVEPGSQPPSGLSVTIDPGQSVCENTLVLFCVEANGTPPLAYQWFKNGVALSGQTESCLTIPAARADDSGEYSVRVTNSAGQSTSSPVSLTVDTAAPVFSRALPLPAALPQAVQVIIQAAPGCGAAGYGVEEIPPAGWTVTAVSDQGVWDEHNHRVRWVFLDGAARTLTYTAVPPADASGTQRFSGVGSVEGQSVPITGDTEMHLVALHPADLDPADWLITLDETTAYIGAYLRGTDWAVEPNPIPLPFVVRAAYLYLQGEEYTVAPDADSPQHWIPAHGPQPRKLTRNSTESDDAPASNGRVRQGYQHAEGGFRAWLRVEPPSDTTAYGVELNLADHWELSSIPENGQYDPINHQVKWVFLDGAERRLEVTIADELADVVLLEGLASFDGDLAAFPQGAQLLGMPMPTEAGTVIHAFGHPGSRLVLEASSDLETWETVSEAREANGATLQFLDASDQPASQRFYRLRELEVPPSAGPAG
jgi:hypothetical protein